MHVGVRRMEERFWEVETTSPAPHAMRDRKETWALSARSGAISHFCRRMDLWHAIVLAIIEGLTEFLPVSSTGHMIIGSTIMGIAQDEFVKVFTVAIQFGAILSVLVLY